MPNAIYLPDDGYEQKKVAALYIRVSSVEQAREGYSLAAQERTLRAYCERMCYKVYAVYADEGISAKDIRHRPAMQQLLSDAKQKKFNVICVWSLSRFTRSVADLYATSEMLSRYGVGFVSMTENFDTSTATGRAMLGILGVFAQMEREITSERVKLAMEERAKQGLPLCSHILGYDKINGRFVVNENEASIVRYIYSSYMESRNMSAVSRECGRLKYTGKRGGVLDPESIHKILSGFFYCGFISWRHNPIPGSHAPIIDTPTYNKVQDIIDEQGKAGGRHRKYELVWLKPV